VGSQVNHGAFAKIMDLQCPDAKDIEKELDSRAKDLVEAKKELAIIANGLKMLAKIKERL